ncbi:MAG TPA: hypothetical protein VME45_00675 [Stellaceae bacterium]|nr:hypothetical protein [Stellaceae bacterium]
MIVRNRFANDDRVPPERIGAHRIEYCLCGLRSDDRDQLALVRDVKRIADDDRIRLCAHCRLAVGRATSAHLLIVPMRMILLAHSFNSLARRRYRRAEVTGREHRRRQEIGAVAVSADSAGQARISHINATRSIDRLAQSGDRTFQVQGDARNPWRVTASVPKPASNGPQLPQGPCWRANAVLATVVQLRPPPAPADAAF